MTRGRYVFRRVAVAVLTYGILRKVGRVIEPNLTCRSQWRITTYSVGRKSLHRFVAG